jgi:hypothetical protein
MCALFADMSASSKHVRIEKKADCKQRLLPTAVLEDIVTYLDGNDLFKSISRVKVAWNRWVLGDLRSAADSRQRKSSKRTLQLWQNRNLTLHLKLPVFKVHADINAAASKAQDDKNARSLFDLVQCVGLDLKSLTLSILRPPEGQGMVAVLTSWERMQEQLSLQFMKAEKQADDASTASQTSAIKDDYVKELIGEDEAGQPKQIHIAVRVVDSAHEKMSKLLRRIKYYDPEAKRVLNAPEDCVSCGPDGDVFYWPKRSSLVFLLNVRRGLPMHENVCTQCARNAMQWRGVGELSSACQHLERLFHWRVEHPVGSFGIKECNCGFRGCMGRPAFDCVAVIDKAQRAKQKDFFG